MYPIPGRLGGLGAGSITIPAPPQLVAKSGPIGPVRVPTWPQQPAIGDFWGAVQIPAQPSPQIVGYSPVLAPKGSGILPPGDPALGMVLSYLYAWLVLDSNANAPWQQAFGYPLIKSPKSLFTHNPSDEVFNVEYLPALYLWRDDLSGGKFEREADDWEMETCIWTLLWVLPLGDQFRQRDRAPYANQFVKAVVDAIETNRTPSWVQPGDPIPDSLIYGSQLGQYTNMVRFRALGWKRSNVRVEISNVSQNVGGSLRKWPAVEMRFEARERLKPDLRKYGTLQQLDQRISNPVTGSQLEHEIDN
jgi:hypothetical protein